jgi:hypothetical protein
VDVAHGSAPTPSEPAEPFGIANATGNVSAARDLSATCSSARRRSMNWRSSQRCSSRGSAGEFPTTQLVAPGRRRDFQRQHDLKPAGCQRITVSGRTIASVSYILGNSRQTPPNISLSIDPNGSLLGLARRSTLIRCRSTTISASSVTRDRSRSIIVPKITFAQIQHRAAASPDCQSTASGLDLR